MKERPDKVYVSFLESGTMSCVYPFREHEDDELYVSLDKACKWLEERTMFGVHPCGGIGLVMEFRNMFMED